MKKIITTALLVFIITINVTSQNDIIWGIQGGINTNLLNAEGVTESSYRSGIDFGTLIEIPLNSNFSFQGELNYHIHNSNGYEDLIGGGGGYKVDYKFKIIQLPVLIKYYPFKRFSVEVGPSFNFLIDDEEIMYLPSGNRKFRGYRKDFYISSVMGATYSIGKGFFGGVKYFKNLSKFYNDNTINDQELKSYHLIIGKKF